MAMGARATVASRRRSAAIAKDGASLCANLINIEAVDTAKMAIVSAIGRVQRELEGFITKGLET